MKFVVVGAGAWGTAFAVHVARNGHDVVLVPRRSQQARELSERRENAEYLPGIILPAELQVMAELDVALTDADVIMLACPAQVLRPTVLRIRESAAPGSRFQLMICLAKGLEL